MVMEPSTNINESADQGGSGTGTGTTTTDVDFELTWMHGYRSHDCRNNLKYASSGKIVYPAASLGKLKVTSDK